MDDFGNEICPIDYPRVDPMVMLWRTMYFFGMVYDNDVMHSFIWISENPL